MTEKAGTMATELSTFAEHGKDFFNLRQFVFIFFGQLLKRMAKIFVAGLIAHLVDDDLQLDLGGK